MTTETAAPPLLDPPAIPDHVLEPLLADGPAYLCQLREGETTDTNHCERVADWLLGCDAAWCGHFRGPVMVCTPCKDEVFAGDSVVLCPELTCDYACYVNWIEAIR